MTQSPPQTFKSPSHGSGESASHAGQVSDTVSEVMDQAQHTARQVSAQAKQGATSRLESQKERAVDSLITVAQALRQTGQHLHEQDQGTVGTYVEKAAERVEGLTNHLRSHDVPELLADTQAFARRRPAMFLGAAIALGFAGARFLMTSGQRAGAGGTRPSPTEGWDSGIPYLQETPDAAAPFEPRGSMSESPGTAARPNTSGVAGPAGMAAS